MNISNYNNHFEHISKQIYYTVIGYPIIKNVQINIIKLCSQDLVFTM